MTMMMTTMTNERRRISFFGASLPSFHQSNLVFILVSGECGAVELFFGEILWEMGSSLKYPLSVPHFHEFIPLRFIILNTESRADQCVFS